MILKGLLLPSLLWGLDCWRLRLLVDSMFLWLNCQPGNTLVWNSEVAKFRRLSKSCKLVQIKVGLVYWAVPGIKTGSKDPTNLVRAERIPASYHYQSGRYSRYYQPDTSFIPVSRPVLHLPYTSQKIVLDLILVADWYESFWSTQYRKRRPMLPGLA